MLGLGTGMMPVIGTSARPLTCRVFTSAVKRTPSWKLNDEMSALLWSDGDAQAEGCRELHVRVRLGLPAVRRGYRFPDRYPSSMAPRTARDLGAFGKGLVLRRKQSGTVTISQVPDFMTTP